MKHFIAGAIVALTLMLGGCTSVAEFASHAAASLSSSTPSQVATLADAVNAATLVTKAADLAVQTGKLDRPTLIEIRALNEAVHTALNALETANAQGKSLDYSAFNAALQAWDAYAVSKGIST